MPMRNHRQIGARARLPLRAGPGEPTLFSLVVDMERLVAQLRELGAPSRAAAHGAIVLNDADHVDFLAVVDLIPERLQDLADRRGVGAAAVRETRDVLGAGVAGLQLLGTYHGSAR